MMMVVGEAWSGTFGLEVSEARRRRANYKMLTRDRVGGKEEKEMPERKGSERNAASAMCKYITARRRRLMMATLVAAPPAVPRT
jgi:hypothetical protein